MAKRKIRKARKSKAKRATPRKTARRRKSSAKKSSLQTRKAYWKAYKKLEKKVDQTWTKLQTHVKKKASPKILQRDHNQLMLLLGECDYLVRQCTRSPLRAKRR